MNNDIQDVIFCENCLTKRELHIVHRNLYRKYGMHRTLKDKALDVFYFFWRK